MKVQNEMATRISVDTISAITSMKDFRMAVSAASSAWRAQEQDLKSSGQYSEAVKARISGLTQVMDIQKAKIAELRSQQAGLNQDNDKQRSQWLNLEKQISQANKQLSNYESQARRAQNSVMRQVSGLADLQKSYRATQSASNAYVNRLNAEKKAASATVAKFKGLKASLVNLESQYRKQEFLLKQIAHQSGENSDAYRKQKEQLDKTVTSITNTKSEMKKMRLEVAELQPTGIKRIDDAVVSLGNHTDRMKAKIKTGFATLKQNALLATGAITTVGGAMVYGAQKASELQDSYLKTNNLLVTGGEKVSEVTRNVRKMQSDGAIMSVKYGISQSKIADAYQELTKRGYTSSQSLGAMKTMLQASVASGDDLNDVVTSSTAAMEAFGLRADGTAKMLKNTKMAVNEMAYAADMTATDFKSMSVAMEYAGPAAKTLGYTVGQTASAIGILSNNGLEADKAGTGLRQVFNSLIRPTKGGTEALNQMGLSVKDFTDKSGKMKSMSQIFDTLNKHSSNLSKQEKGAVFKALFGSTGESAGIILADNSKKLADLNKNVKNSYKGQGYVQQLAKKNMGSAKMSMSQFKEAANAASITLGKALMPALRDAAVAMSKSFNSKDGQKGLKEIAGFIGKVTKAVVDLVVALGKHTTTVKIFGGAILGVAGALKVMQGILVTVDIVKRFSKLAGVAKGIRLVGTAVKFATAGFNPWVIGIELVIGALVLLYTHSKTFRKMCSDMGKLAVKAGKAIVNGFKAVINWFKSDWKQIALFLVNPIAGGIALLYKHNKKFRSFVNGLGRIAKSGMKAVGHWFSSTASSIGKDWNDMKQDTTKTAQDMLRRHEQTFKSGYKVIGDQTQTWRDLVSGHWGNLSSDTRRTASDMSKLHQRLFKDMYNRLNEMTGGRLGDMVKAWQDKMGSIGDTVANAKSAIHKHFVDMVRGIIKPFNDMLGDLQKGINWVLDKLGASKIGGSWQVPMPSYATGTQGAHPGGFAKVNDGKTAHYREIYRLPNGQVGMFPAVRDMIVPLPKGTSVLDGDRSFFLAQLMGQVPHYANGIGDFFANLKDDATNFLENTDKFLAHPIEFMKSVFKRFVHVSTPVKFASELVTSVPKFIAEQMADWVKKQFATLTNPGGAGVERWRPYIEKAFKELHVTATETKINKLLRQIQTESNGNPLAFQHGYVDKNTGGNEARGLLQFAGSTWAADALPGHTDWRNGYNEILAAIHVLERGGEGGWGNVGNGHGWENGGLINQHGMYEVGEYNRPEMIVPLDMSKRSRAYQLLGEIVARFHAEDPSHGTIAKNDDGLEKRMDQMNRKFDQLLDMFGQLLGLSGSQLQAIKDQGSFDPKKQYKQQALDAVMRAYS